MKKGDKFTCAHYKETFESDWTDEEAIGEREENGWTDIDCAVVCDDCYKAVLANPNVTEVTK